MHVMQLDVDARVAPEQHREHYHVLDRLYAMVVERVTGTAHAGLSPERNRQETRNYGSH